MFASLIAVTSPRQAFSPKQISTLFFFKSSLDEDGALTGYHVCKAHGKQRMHAPRTAEPTRPRAARTVHPNFESDMRDTTTAVTGTLVSWVSQKANNRYGWLKWVILGSLPLSFCESRETCQSTNWAFVSVDALLSNIESLTKIVGSVVEKGIPEDFGLILDVSSFGTEQYQAVYGCCNTPSGTQYPLLSMAPVMDEPSDHQTA
ncbi:hypothetical protein PI124_g14901 [Phytophthora idaei]|nr:hypothetical protein PI126_g21121 [Phytophthora idaei]KAG3240194.1 hypothetical protein PI124_g14901 [Phytophthora idaei]